MIKLLQLCNIIEGIKNLYLYTRIPQLIPKHRSIGLGFMCIIKNANEENIIDLITPYLLYNLFINIPLKMNSSVIGAKITAAKKLINVINGVVNFGGLDIKLDCKLFKTLGFKQYTKKALIKSGPYYLNKLLLRLLEVQI